MAYGSKAFNVIQMSNAEDALGTAEAATEVIIGTITHVTTDKIFHNPVQDRGLLLVNYEAPFQISDKVELEIEGELYDRLCVFIFSNSIAGNITATQPNVGTEPLHYLWTFNAGLTTQNTPDIAAGIDTFTIEFGDNVQHYETEYLVTSKVEISGVVDESIMFTWSVFGRQVTESALTAALVAPAMANFAFNNTSFYIDANYAGLGGTQKTGMLRAFTWTFETGFTPRYAADGNLFFSGVNEAAKKVDLELTYYRDGTNSEAAKDIWESQALTYISIEMLSSTEMDSAQGNPEYLKLQGAYRYVDWPAYEDEDGSSVITVKLESAYDLTGTEQMTVLVGTTMSAYA